MLNKLFWFGVGFLVARYVIFNTENYPEKEAAALDSIRSGVHDLIKKYAPEADDQAVQNDVISTVK
jgi:hypothetical protein